MKTTRMDSRWSPCAVQMNFKHYCRLKPFPDGVHVDSIWNLWERVKYRSIVGLCPMNWG